MYLFRWFIFLMLLASAGMFLFFALTGQEKYKKIGLTSIKITIAIGLIFFVVIMLG